MSEYEAVKLVQQTRNGDYSTISYVVASLRLFGWMTDGSLRGADLSGIHLGYANLHTAILIRTNLSGSDLRGACLTNTDLYKADLQQANLRGANLRQADLSGSDLSWADLRGADLSYTNLIEANLRGANLDGSSLQHALLSRTMIDGTLLVGVDMSNAYFGSTIVNDADLSAVEGLETISHGHPSSIGVDTLYRSKGQIPEVFLRGCGLPEDFIAYSKSLIGKATDFYSCFISYSHDDQTFARRLHDTLQGRGIRCWLDKHQMKPGDEIYTEVDRGIRLWDKVLLCCSRHSLTSWWVDSEIDKAFRKERELMKERQHKVLALIPLDLDGYLFSDDYQNGKKSEIHTRLAANFNGWEHDNSIFEREFERVVQALRTDSGKESPPKPKL